MAEVWQGQYWDNGSVAYSSSNASGYYDSTTGFCNYSKSGNNGLGNLIAGWYGSVYNVAGLRFAPTANYSKVVVTCYNASSYTSNGKGSVKYLITTSPISNPTQSVMEGYTATGTYTCTGDSYDVNTLTFNYNFKSGKVYYIYFWSNGEKQTWRFRWYAPTTNNYGFSAAYTAATTYKLNTTTGANTTLTVKRTSSPFGSTGTLANGATLYSGDNLQISFSAGTGYDLTTHTVNGSNFTSGDTHTVKSAVTVVSAASVKSFTLTLSAGTGSTISVSRTSSPKGGAATGALSNGATIYYSDVLKISFSASTGYDLGTHTVNGSTFTSGNSHTVTAAVTVKATATLKTFTLSITAGKNGTVTVNRTKAAGGSTGALSNGAKLYYGDVLKITLAPSSGYKVKSATLNGSAIETDASHTVKGAVTVAVTFDLKAGVVYVDTGKEIIPCYIYVDTGTTMQLVTPYVDTGSAIVPCQ